ncbi:MAG: endonuclease Q family protein [Candidatus Ranarchaeia archaeon]
MTLEYLSLYGKMKGLNVLATGDITHPRWCKELRQKLLPLGGKDTGVFQLKASQSGISFILSGEVSNNFIWENKTKRIHNLILVPNFEVLDQVNEYLGSKGKLALDGRPDLGLDCEAMIHDLKSISGRIEIIAAHIWTSHFACLGARGFDSIRDCYGRETDNLLALETGLSSDPPMSWRVSELNNFPLVSNSDCHSPYPNRIGREANLLKVKKLTYDNIINSIRHGGKTGDFVLTIETYPEYGKYYYTGHRADRQFLDNGAWRTHGKDVCLSPQNAISNNNRCPICGHRLTVGVLQRVEQLSDRPIDYKPPNAVPFKHLIPLHELIAKAKGIQSPFAKTVWQIYSQLIKQFGSEYRLMLYASPEEIRQIDDPAVRRLLLSYRENEIIISPGFDGVYGHISLSEQPDASEKPMHKATQLRLDDFT